LRGRLHPATVGQTAASGRPRPPRGSSVEAELFLSGGVKAGHGALVGRGAGRGGLVGRGPEALVAQEALEALWVVDQGAQLHVAATGRTVVHVKAEGQAQKLGPSDVAAAGAGARGFGCNRTRCRLFRWGGVVGGSGALVRGWRNDQGPPARVGGQHACVDDHVLPWGRHRSRQPARQVRRRRRAASPANVRELHHPRPRAQRRGRRAGGKREARPRAGSPVAERRRSGGVPPDAIATGIRAHSLWAVVKDYSCRNRSASMAAMQPVPAAVTAWR
jgi:hypothetical protein